MLIPGCHHEIYKNYRLDSQNNPYYRPSGSSSINGAKLMTALSYPSRMSCDYGKCFVNFVHCIRGSLIAGHSEVRCSLPQGEHGAIRGQIGSLIVTSSVLMYDEKC